MNLARAYYAAGNFPQAAHYWSELERGDPKWLDAQFERALDRQASGELSPFSSD